jgi:hypothetical protein
MDPSFGKAIKVSSSKRNAVMTQALNIPSLGTSPEVKEAVEATTEWISNLIGPDANPQEPLVRLVYPIVQSQASLQGFVSSEDKGRVVAIVASSFFWSTLLRGILPSGQDGVVVVINNACGQTFTYELNGGQAVYLGDGDLHDVTFSEFAIYANFTGLSEYAEQEDVDHYYSGWPIDEEYCLYNITIYPSETFEAKYRSDDPNIFTYSVILLFLFTSCCFLGYDKLVTARQTKVMQSAAKSNAIISSLFPSNVRDRLYDGDVQAAQSFQPTKARLRNFLDDNEDPTNVSRHGCANKPIADLFTECTVMFAVS